MELVPMAIEGKVSCFDRRSPHCATKRSRRSSEQSGRRKVAEDSRRIGQVELAVIGGYESSSGRFLTKDPLVITGSGSYQEVIVHWSPLQVTSHQSIPRFVMMPPCGLLYCAYLGVHGLT